MKNAFLFLLLIAFSCKNVDRTKHSKNRESSRQKTLTVTLQAIVKANDDFELYFVDDKYDPYFSITVNIDNLVMNLFKENYGENF